MFRVFSGSCLSLEDMDSVFRRTLIKQPHVLGPGADFFTEDGQPVQPQLGAVLQRVFSGSALDLNEGANATEFLSDDDAGTPLMQPRSLPVSTILHQLSSETEKERSKSAKSKVTVLVIGDNAYISNHVIAKLLDCGYTVRVTLMDAGNTQQQIDLYTMNRTAAARLTVMDVDMTNSAALREAIKGCKYIIHCGCPTAAAKEANLVAYHTAAVQALFDAVRLGAKSVKRIILTGAASSVFHITDQAKTFDETCWNSVATASTDPVPYAKMIFEREAWRLKQLLGVELVVLLPSIPIGPSRSQETSEVIVTILSLASAPWYFPFCPDLYWNFVDVRDVAEAHVLALETPDLKDQRVLISNSSLSLPELCRMMKRIFPHLTFPTRTANNFLTLLVGSTQSARGVRLKFLWRNLGIQKELETTKATKLLGLQLTPMDETLGDCIRQLINSGALPKAPEAGTHKKGSKLAWALGALAMGGTLAVVYQRMRRS